MAAEGWKQGGDWIGIPAPSGRHAVGCVDLMHKFPDEEDGHLVRLFYPSEGGAGYKYTKCIPDKQYTEAQFRCIGIVFPEFLNVSQLPSSKPQASTVVHEKVEQPVPLCPALTEAPLLGASADQSKPTFPVIVYSHGLISMRTDYSGICCDLASHGYVVASVEHRDRSACVSLRRVPKPGGAPRELQDEWLEFYYKKETEDEFPLRNRQVKQRASEVGKSLDILGLLNDGVDVQNMMDVRFDFGQFRGRVDLSTAAVMGHSFGGASTVQTLLTDQRFKCGIALDCWMVPIHQDVYDTGVPKPLLFINSFDFQWKENVQRMLRLVKEPDERGISTCQVITLRDSKHMNQTDFYFAMPSFVIEKTISRIDPTLAHVVNLELCHSFLGRFLLQDPAHQQPIPNLDGGEGHSDVVLFETNVDLSDPPEEPQGGESGGGGGDGGDSGDTGEVCEGGDGGGGGDGGEGGEQCARGSSGGGGGSD